MSDWNLLILPGGGAGFIHQAAWLSRLPKGVIAKVNVLGGTSAGSINAAGLAVGMEPEELRGLGRRFLPAIFGWDTHRNVVQRQWNADYSDRGLVHTLNEAFGDVCLGGARLVARKGLVIPACPVERPDGRDEPLKVFSSVNEDDDDAKQRLADIVAASASAPKYLPSHRWADPGGEGWWDCWDGGLLANNPVFETMAEVLKVDPSAKFKILIIGCGWNKLTLSGGDRSGIRVLNTVLQIPIAGSVDSRAYILDIAFGHNTRSYYFNPVVHDYAVDGSGQIEQMEQAAKATDMTDLYDWLDKHW